MHRKKTKVKKNPCQRLRVHRWNPWAIFDLSSVAAGSQSAMQQIELRVKKQRSAAGGKANSSFKWGADVMDKRENMDRMNDENGCERMLKTLYRLCSQVIIMKKTNKSYKRKTIIWRKYLDRIQIISWIFTKNPRFHRKKDALSKNGHFCKKYPTDFVPSVRIFAMVT